MKHALIWNIFGMFLGATITLTAQTNVTTDGGTIGTILFTGTAAVSNSAIAQINEILGSIIFGLRTSFHQIWLYQYG